MPSPRIFRYVRLGPHETGSCIDIPDDEDDYDKAFDICEGDIVIMLEGRDRHRILFLPCGAVRYVGHAIEDGNDLEEIG